MRRNAGRYGPPFGSATSFVYVNERSSTHISPIGFSELLPSIPSEPAAPTRAPSSSSALSHAGDHQRLLTVEEAASCLSTTPTALRARCRRRSRRVGREIVAHLGAGVVAYKFGASWRVRIAPE
jgi:hypothetical protein